MRGSASPKGEARREAPPRPGEAWAAEDTLAAEDAEESSDSADEEPTE